MTKKLTLHERLVRARDRVLIRLMKKCGMLPKKRNIRLKEVKDE